MYPSPRLIRLLRHHGIVYPIRTARAARAAKIPLSLACALLDQESGGGHNVFGHDPTIFVGAGTVTETKYRAYRRARLASGNRKMQGVGPCQLTYYSIQDEADKAGGCWRPGINMQVGFRILATNIKKLGRHEGIAAYNGSGRAAEAYANSVERLASEWHKILTR